MESSRKVARHKIRRLYQDDAQRMLDEALVNEVAYGFYARCAALLDGIAVDPEAAKPTRRAPVVERPARWEGFVKRARQTWEVSWREDIAYPSLAEGGPAPVLAYYMTRLPHARSPREKMLLINQLTHECHNSLRDDAAPYPLALELITGTAEQILAMFDALAYGRRSLPGVR